MCSGFIHIKRDCEQADKSGVVKFFGIKFVTFLEGFELK